ncbi:Ribosome biogenesis protein erb1 [Bacidia gigantensis]|uniref:Ribosome biogenesis protein erb1 n=1 Tax=Bacidia gigantensis TaxID=2732470 RepID=UPI001D04DC39|nr:Ribosome biogenesis protein erb1 [Bacidia gigantensis]KAG8533483.1 Ribosome biogenesis protein erb1 [Bacidia gigantensis]
MSPQASGKKRKAFTRDSPKADEIVLSDGSADEFEATFSSELESHNNGTRLEDEDPTSSSAGEEDEKDEWESEESDGDLESDEIPSDEDQNAADDKTIRELSPDEEATTNGSHGADFKLETDANGNLRYIYPEIDPVYDSDDSEAPATTNTIGNIPLSFYDAYPHIGYDINGKRLSRPAKGEALDALLDSIEVPKGWTGLTDPATGKPLELSKEELDILKRIQTNEVPEDGYDPYPATIEYFTSKTEQMPLSSAPEPKRRFVPSKHEAKRVMKIVRAIREGRIMPYKPPAQDEEEDTDVKRYDIWANEAPRPDHPMNVPAPKLPPPGYEESYHPPPEYLPDDEEKKAWDEQDEEDKEKDFLPTNHDSLRKVPGYDSFLKEKFERCLDLYLAPRIRRSKLNIDPESLLPKLPSPEELRPFPTMCATIFGGHEGRVRSLSISPSGYWLASGGDDGAVRIYELRTGYEVWSVKLSKDEAVNVVRWRPGTDAMIIAAAAGEDVYLIVPPSNVPAISNPEVNQQSRELLNAGWGYAANGDSKPKKDIPQWARPGSQLEESGVLVKFALRKTVKVITWHRRGQYFATVSPEGQSNAVAIHTLSKHQTQFPFRNLKGLAQAAHFHPSKPAFFVATQRMIRHFDLSKQELVKIIQPGARWISSFDVHPGGDNLIVGSYDKRLLWHDLELSVRPYKTLRYHQKAIRAVRFHQGGLPLFADASDDGSLQIFHGKVVHDAMENASIVPLKSPGARAQEPMARVDCGLKSERERGDRGDVGVPDPDDAKAKTSNNRRKGQLLLLA